MGVPVLSRPASAEKVLLQAAHLPAELRRRIQSTLDDQETPAFVRLTLRVLVDLSQPVLGSTGPVSLYALQFELERRGLLFSPRLIKRAIKELIETHGIAIGAARQANRGGYFFVSTDAEAQKAVEPLMGEIRSLARRIRCLSPASPYIQHLLGQMEVL
jgi:hypothetical protein